MNLKEELKKLRTKLSGKSNQPTTSRPTVVKSELTEEEEKMMLESIGKFREGFKSSAAEATANHFAKIRNVNLDAKVDNFIEWYFKNMVKGHYTDIGEFHKPNDMRNFI